MKWIFIGLLVLMPLTTMVVSDEHPWEKPKAQDLMEWPLCDEPTDIQPIKDSITVIAPHGDIKLIIPTDAKPASEEEYWFKHGGAVWKSEAIYIEIQYGSWAPLSFYPGDVDDPDDNVDFCRTSVNDLVALMGSYTDSTCIELFAWLQIPGRVHDPVVKVIVEPEQLSLARSILWSIESVVEEKAP